MMEGLLLHTLIKLRLNYLQQVQEELPRQVGVLELSQQLRQTLQSPLLPGQLLVQLLVLIARITAESQSHCDS